MKSFRSKPVGWMNESYRHYLAAKGIKTKTRYFATETAFGRAVEGFQKELDTRRKRLARSAESFSQNKLQIARAQAKAPSLRGLSTYRRWLDRDGKEVPEGTVGAVQEKISQRDAAIASGLTPDEQKLQKDVLQSAGVGVTAAQTQLAKAHEFNEIIADDQIEHLQKNIDATKKKLQEAKDDIVRLENSPEVMALTPEMQRKALLGSEFEVQRIEQTLKAFNDEQDMYEKIKGKYEQAGHDMGGINSNKERQLAGRAVLLYEKRQDTIAGRGRRSVTDDEYEGGL